MRPFWQGFYKLAKADKEVATIAVINGGSILMGKRRDNEKWTNPGGHMDPGETPIEGAKRELFEETGIKADSLDFMNSKTITKPDGSKIKVHAFKLDAGKHKTTMSNDPDQEVYRWQYIKLPLPNHIRDHLHVPKGNVIFDSLGIDYKSSEKTAASRNAVMDALRQQFAHYLHQNDKHHKDKSHQMGDQI